MLVVHLKRAIIERLAYIGLIMGGSIPVMTRRLASLVLIMDQYQTNNGQWVHAHRVGRWQLITI